MCLQPLIASMIGAACAEVLLGLSKTAAIGGVVFPRFLGVGCSAVGAVVALAFAFGAFAAVCLKFWIVKLWVVAHQAAFDATDVAFHCLTPIFLKYASISACTFSMLRTSSPSRVCDDLEMRLVAELMAV